MDILSKAERSALMSRVRGRDTKPEMIVRRLLHRMGYRYRLHRRDLPGKPDIVFVTKKKVVFVNGCFWHGHLEKKCKLARMPKSRIDFWKAKIDYNRSRDERNTKALNAMGWGVFAVWECELKDMDAIRKKLVAFLGLRRKKRLKNACHL